jgi:hypothetical protein
MPGNGSRTRASLAWTAGLLLTTALAACSGGGAPAPTGSADALAPPVALPLSTTVPATLASAPPVTALPAGPPVRVAQPSDRRQGYRYLDRGLYQEDAVEDAPPDYSFDGGGVRPWTWATGDGARVISEPVAGGYRTYYYDAGSDTPYLVRDPQYAYAYDNGALVSVFTVAGVQIDLRGGSDAVQYGGRYLARGHALWGHATSGPHLAVNAYVWSDRRADLAAQRVAWQRHIADNPDWSAWNSAHQAEEQAPWTDVRAQHQQAAQQFVTWQQQRFQGAPPQLYMADGSAPPPPPAPDRRDHTGAVVGGVVAAGIVAGAVHGVAGHREPPHQSMGPAARPEPAQNPAMVPADRRAPGNRAEPGRPMVPVRPAPTDQRHAPRPAAPVYHPPVAHAPVDHAPVYHAPVAAPHANAAPPARAAAPQHRAEPHKPAQPAGHEQPHGPGHDRPHGE